MAGFRLEVGSNRKSGNSITIGVHPDFDFDLLDVDPYEDSQWSGEKLESWSKKIQLQIDNVNDKIKNDVLKKVRKEKFESWMNPLLFEQQNSSYEFGVLEKLNEMIQMAKETKSTVRFYGD